MGWYEFTKNKWVYVLNGPVWITMIGQNCYFPYKNFLKHFFSQLWCAKLKWWSCKILQRIVPMPCWHVALPKQLLLLVLGMQWCINASTVPKGAGGGTLGREWGMAPEDCNYPIDIMHMRYPGSPKHVNIYSS